MIEGVEGVVPGEVRVRVGIAYLCDKLPTAGAYVVVSLRGCRRMEYEPYGEKVLSGLEEIGEAGLEVLSAGEAGGGVEVGCVGGVLRMAYEGVEIVLAEGRVISQEELEGAAERYWTEWEDRAKRGRE